MPSPAGVLLSAGVLVLLAGVLLLALLAGDWLLFTTALSPFAAGAAVVIVEILEAVTMQHTEQTQMANTVTTETSLESTGESYSWLFFIFGVTPFMDYNFY